MAAACGVLLRLGVGLVVTSMACVETRSAAPLGHDGNGLRIELAALSYPGVEDVCYSFAVTSAAADVVIARGPLSTHADPARNPAFAGWANGASLQDTSPVCATQFGNGAGGDWSYVAPCDASVPGDHTVTLWLDTLTLDGNVTAAPGLDYQDPCPTGCALQATCQENADTPVTFNITVMRNAQQGFFDIGVNFDNIFCSAKVDCLTDGGQPLTLLHHPDTGLRGQTAVLGLACTAGPGAEGTVLLRDPITMTCGTDVYTLDPAQPEGNVYTPATGANPAPTGSPVWQYAVYAGEEALDCGGQPCNKVYWNVAIGFDPLAEGCTLTTAATAGTPTSLPELSTPEASTWPIIEADVDLTLPGGGLACSAHPLNGSPAGVETGYTAVGPGRAFSSGFDGQTYLEPTPTGIVEDGLMMWLDAGVEASYPGSGATWFDLSGNGRHATLFNSPGFTTESGGGIVMNGTTQYGQGAVIEPQRFTLGAWFRGTGPPSTNDAFGGNLLNSSPQLTGGVGQYALTWSWTHERGVGSVQANGSYAVTPDDSMPANATHYLVVTYDGARRRLYHNGQLVDDDAYSADPVYPTSGVRNLQIARWGYPSWGRYFNGVYFQAVIYDRALSEAEVLQNFNADRDRFGL